MQNPYAMERFIQEHNAHGRAVAELQALQRRAIASRRRDVVSGWLARLSRLFARPSESPVGRDSETVSPAPRSGEIPWAQARR